MPEVERQSGLIGKEGGDVRRWLLREARRIALAYQSGVEDAEFLRRPNLNGQLPVERPVMKRIPIPPFRRPDNFLKTHIYELADKVSQNPGYEIELEMLVRRSKNIIRSVHRPRNATAVDWSIRLIRGYLFIRKTGDIKDLRVNKISNSIVSRWSIELNYALKCGIKPEFCTMFIDYMGGYEYIAAGILDGKNDPSKMPWWNDVTKVKIRAESLQEMRIRKANERLAELAEWG